MQSFLWPITHLTVYMSLNGNANREFVMKCFAVSIWKLSFKIIDRRWKLSIRSHSANGHPINATVISNGKQFWKLATLFFCNIAIAQRVVDAQRFISVFINSCHIHHCYFVVSCYYSSKFQHINIETQLTTCHYHRIVSVLTFSKKEPKHTQKSVPRNTHTFNEISK